MPPHCPYTLAMRCVICNDQTKKDYVARRHLEGHSANAMEGLSRAAGMPIKRETIRKHLTVCLQAPAEATPKAVKAMAATVRVPKDTPSEDVATLVQRQVIEKLNAGEARVTVQHGLQAQNLIDRREERSKDRELAITLARLLHAPMPPQGMVHERPTIEGVAVEISSGD